PRRVCLPSLRSCHADRQSARSGVGGFARPVLAFPVGRVPLCASMLLQTPDENQKTRVPRLRQHQVHVCIQHGRQAYPDRNRRKVGSGFHRRQGLSMNKSKRDKEKVKRIATTLLSWFAENARDLPWRRTSDPYAIWVSEIMLQQTQVKT